MPTYYTGLDGSIESHGNLENNLRNQNNTSIGFYIDDIIVGFAERGEMVTAASDNQDTYSVPDWVQAALSDKAPQYVGEYQLEIRRGTEYANNVLKDESPIAIVELFDTNARLIPDGYDWVWTGSSGNWSQTQVYFDTHHYVGTYVGNYRGDQNVERQQDELIIENNTIRDVADTGILIDSGSREGTDVPQPGSAINYPVLNTSDLVPGVVVTNNVIAYFGDTGILFSGDSDQSADPVTPFGRIVNNTIVGTSTSVSDYGIRVTDYASPTILNNIITTTGIAISISSNSSSTVSNYNLFQGNASNGTTNSYDISLASGASLFVNAAVYNFYLAAGSLAIDSSIDALGERTALSVVKSPLVIPLSPIIAPERDRYGQLRLDDPSQSPPSGMGANIFKDRGAIERADFAGPTAMVVDPEDDATARDPLNPKIDGSYDYDSSAHDVVVINQKTTDFAIQLSDSGGIGIDDSSILVDPTAADPVVKTGLVTVYRAPSLDVFSAVAESDWPTLRLGTDYLLDYDTVNNILHVIPATGVWESGAYYVIDVNNTMVQDLAGNVLQPNRSTAPFTGKTLFTIQLTGLDFGDLPDDADDLVDPDYVTLLNSGPADGQGGARHVVTGGVYLGSPRTWRKTPTRRPPPPIRSTSRTATSSTRPTAICSTTG